MNKRKYTFDTSGFSCQNTDCHKYHKVNEGNVRFAYMSGKYKQIAYLKCTACGRCFSENKGTIFFRRKKAKKPLLGYYKTQLRAVALELPEESLVSARIQFLLGLKQQVKIH